MGRSDSKIPILILSDGKMGHLKQSLAVASLIEGGESRVIPVNYRFLIARLLLIFASYFYLKKRGNHLLLKWFLKSETFDSILRHPAEIIISAGAGISVTNLLAAKVLSAKSVVIMKPPGGGQHRYTLRIIPEHDLPRRLPNTVTTLGAPTVATPDFLISEAKKLKLSHRLINRKYVSLFIGGNSSKYRFDLKLIPPLIKNLKNICKEANSDLLITTSRRTPKEIDLILKQEFASYSHCKLLIIWKEKPDDCVAGMMGISESIIVTEDSISMISDAVSSGKRVIVLKMNEMSRLKKKHKRFIQTLEDKGYVTPATIETLSEAILDRSPAKMSVKLPNDLANDRTTIQEALKQIL